MNVSRAMSPESSAITAALLFPEDPDSRSEALAAGERAIWLTAHLADEISDETIRGAALVIQGEDGVLLVWPPRVAPSLEREIEDDIQAVLLAAIQEVLRIAVAEAAHEPVAYAQALSDEQDLERYASLQRIGFEHAGRIVFLGKDLGGAEKATLQTPSSSDAEWRTVSFEELGDPALFERLLDETLVGSLDLPCLEGLRSGAQMLAGQRGSPRFSSQLTRVAFVKNRPVAVGMLCEDSDRATVEVAYLGVVAGQRGHKYGGRLLKELEQRTTARGQRWMILAVDITNHFAIDVYNDAQYVALFAREVFLWRPTGSPPSN